MYIIEVDRDSYLFAIEYEKHGDTLSIKKGLRRTAFMQPTPKGLGIHVMDRIIDTKHLPVFGFESACDKVETVVNLIGRVYYKVDDPEVSRMVNEAYNNAYKQLLGKEAGLVLPNDGIVNPADLT